MNDQSDVHGRNQKTLRLRANLGSTNVKFPFSFERLITNLDPINVHAIKSSKRQLARCVFFKPIARSSRSEDCNPVAADCNASWHPDLVAERYLKS